MRISRDIVRKYNGRGHDKALATAVQLKSYYRNGTIYNYRSKDLHKWVGISKQSFDKYISILLSNKDAVVINGNLTINRLCSAFNTKGEQWVRINTRIINNKSVSDTVIYINSLIFRLEAGKQEYLIELKDRSSKGMNPKTKAEHDRAKGATKVLEGLGVEWDSINEKYSIHKEINFSIEGISDKLNMSVYKTYKMINSLKKDNLLAVDRNIIPIRYLGKKGQSIKTSHSTFISRNGNEFVCLPNSYRFHSSYTL